MHNLIAHNHTLCKSRGVISHSIVTRILYHTPHNTYITNVPQLSPHLFHLSYTCTQTIAPHNTMYTIKKRVNDSPVIVSFPTDTTADSFLQLPPLRCPDRKPFPCRTGTLFSFLFHFVPLLFFFARSVYDHTPL